MPFFHPAFYLSSYILPRDPQERLRSNKHLNRTISCEPVGKFISSHPGMPRDPIQPHSVPGRDIVQCLLALSHQRRRCFGSLKCFKSHLYNFTYVYSTCTVCVYSACVQCACVQCACTVRVYSVRVYSVRVYSARVQCARVQCARVQ
jgi:hypothetical protein